MSSKEANKSENLFTVKMPTGVIAIELQHFMGLDDEMNLKERPTLAQQVARKCFLGKTAELTKEELVQFIHEVDNAIDIKQDHIGSGWSSLMQYHLCSYYEKLNEILKPNN